ncbi:MAG: hypothetical protein IPH58_14485 [Sphingobacteriales bacterium]|nr:hypothetical protein [Sphingobacteriales bacterium]
MNNFRKQDSHLFWRPMIVMMNFWGMLFILKIKKGFMKLVLPSPKKGRDLEAHPYIIDHMIGQHADTDYIFDFEGSNIRGIEKFNQSFGAVLEPYYAVSWNNLPLPLRLFKK